MSASVGLSAQTPLADSLYTAGAYAGARPLYAARAQVFAEADRPDSAAYYGWRTLATDLQQGRTGDAAAYLADTLRPLAGASAYAATLVDLARFNLAFRTFEVPLADSLAGSLYERLATHGLTEQKVNLRSMGSLVQLMLGRPDSAVALGRAAVRIAEAAYPACDKIVGYAHNALASVHTILEDVDAAAEQLALAVQALEVALPRGHPHRAMLMVQLADLESYRGRYDRALRYAVEGERRARETEQPKARATAAASLSNVLYDLHDFAGAHEAARETLRQLRRADAQPGEFFNPYLRAFDAASAAGRAHLAATYVDSARAIALAEDFYGEAGFRGYEPAAAQVALDRGDTTEARRLYRYVLRATDADPEAYIELRREVATELGGLALARRDLDEAERMYAVAKTVVDSSGSAASTFGQPTILLGVRVALARGDYDEAANRLRVLTTAFPRSGGLREAATAEPLVWSPVLRAYDELARASGRSLDTNSVRELLAGVRAGIGSHVRLIPAEVWSEQHADELRRVFTFGAFLEADWCRRGDGEACARAAVYADLPRATNLRRRAADVLAAEYLSLPDTLARVTRTLETRRRALASSELDSVTLRRELDDLARRTNAHRAHLRATYPGYFTAVHAGLEADLDALVAATADGERRFVSFLTDTLGGRLLVAQLVGGEVGVATADYGPGERAAVRRFVSAVQDPRGRVAAPAREAAQLLIGPLGSLAEGEELVVTADVTLDDVPFAALLLAEADARSPMAAWPWLARTHALSYADSWSAYRPGAAARGGLGAFTALAPGFEAGLPVAAAAKGANEVLAEAAAAAVPGRALAGKAKAMLRTPWTMELVSGLAERYGAETWIGEEATERRLVAGGSTRDLVHLGTHAYLDQRQPLRSYFVLADEASNTAFAGSGVADTTAGLLYAYELYAQPLATRLAVLPTCHSGAGAYSVAEGTLSLATAIRSGGCPTVLQSFWSIDDQQTNALLAGFYEQLLGRGVATGAALAAAQRGYLLAAAEPLQHPYYWAGLVAVGPEQRFATGLRAFVPWLIAGGILAVIGLFVYAGGRS